MLINVFGGKFSMLQLAEFPYGVNIGINGFPITDQMVIIDDLNSL